MATVVMIKHPASGMLKKGFYGFSWTYLFWGFLVPLFRGELGIALLHVVFTVLTVGFWQVVVAFLYNKQYMTRMLTEKGFVLADSPERERAARLKLGMVVVE